MARMLLNPPNFLVLDEPTNHLDLATKEMLLDALKDFDGTMLFVSHDRAFLRGLSNRVLELGGESGTDAQPHVYPGLVRRVRRAHRPRSARRASLRRAAADGPVAPREPPQAAAIRRRATTRQIRTIRRH